MRVYWVFLLVGLSLAALGQQRESFHEVTIRNSKIQIDGATNVSGFSCGLVEAYPTDTFSVVSQWSHLSISFQRMNLTFQVRSFDCGLDLMTADFRSILKEPQYPQLTLQIKRINVSERSEGFDELMVDSEILVTIAGVMRSYWLQDAQVINRTDSDLTLKGRKTLKMTDFGIVPPSKFFGTVRVQDELTVSFEVDMSVRTIKKGRG